MNVSGKIHLIGQTETVGNNGFTKRQIVVETSEQYPQKVAIDFVKDKCSILDSYKVGQEVTVDVNVRGSEYNGKFYVNLQGWKINALSNETRELFTYVEVREVDEYLNNKEDKYYLSLKKAERKAKKDIQTYLFSKRHPNK